MRGQCMERAKVSAYQAIPKSQPVGGVKQSFARFERWVARGPLLGNGALDSGLKIVVPCAQNVDGQNPHTRCVELECIHFTKHVSNRPSEPQKDALHQGPLAKVSILTRGLACGIHGGEFP